MTNTINGLDGAHELLIKLVDQTPEDWGMRKKVAQVLYDARYYRDASKMIWNAPEIPPVGEDVVYATKIVAKGQPTRAMRLINTVIEKNLGHPEENLAMAKLFMKADMPLQAVRFYGAAVALDGKLIDERFEVSLLNADVEALPWNEEVMNEDFPWEGPQDFVEPVTEAEAEDAHAALLNGLTQPVPMKAPVREKNPVHESEKKEPVRELPKWKVQEGKTTFVREKVEDIQPVEDQSIEQEVVAAQSEAPVEPVLQEDKRDELIKEFIQEVESHPDVKEEDEVADEVVPNAEPAFFKSYDDAHQRQEEQSDFAAQVEEEIAPEPEEEQAPVEVQKDAVFQIDASDVKDDLDDYVADAMAEYESSDSNEEQEEAKSLTSGVAGAFSSLMSRFRKPKPEVESEADFLPEEDEVVVEMHSEPVMETSNELAEEVPAEVPVEAVAPEPAPEPESVPAPVAVEQPVAKPAPPVVEKSKPSPLDKPGVHTSVQKLVSQSQPQPEPELPKELDGRTQLVALAPEDGRAFFDQLLEKYRNVQPDQLPNAAAVARDMANVDYLTLIKQACDKDLDAFSRLLGLHRVMASSNCGDWGEDMNLLRKGYGDAVLATIVSKYSVTECREILNSVYQYPSSAAAAV